MPTATRAPVATKLRVAIIEAIQHYGCVIEAPANGKLTAMINRRIKHVTDNGSIVTSMQQMEDEGWFELEFRIIGDLGTRRLNKATLFPDRLPQNLKDAVALLAIERGHLPRPPQVGDTLMAMAGRHVVVPAENENVAAGGTNGFAKITQLTPAQHEQMSEMLEENSRAAVAGVMSTVDSELAQADAEIGRLRNLVQGLEETLEERDQLIIRLRNTIRDLA